jgi:2,3-bisphosphoglycerate-independent phosphoglycerate mutase
MLIYKAFNPLTSLPQTSTNAICTTTAIIIVTILKEMEGEDISILLLPDHPTPISARTHTRAPVPFVLYDSENEVDSGINCYSEKGGVGGVYLDKGEKLIDLLLGGK